MSKCACTFFLVVYGVPNTPQHEKYLSLGSNLSALSDVSHIYK